MTFALEVAIVRLVITPYDTITKPHTIRCARPVPLMGAVGCKNFTGII
jgi:hypothetical protein